MVPREEIRRLKLRELCKEFGNATKLADIATIAPSEIHRVLRGERNLGDILARRIEDKAKKPPHWLDHLDFSPQAYDVACRWDGLPDEEKAVILRIIASSKRPDTEVARSLQSHKIGAASQREAEIHNERLRLEQEAASEGQRRDKAHREIGAKNNRTPDNGVPGTHARGPVPRKPTPGRKKT